MFKKIVAALMFAGIASGPAFALTDAGFEDDARFDVSGAAIPSGSGYVWANGDIYRSGSDTLSMFDDRTGDLLTSAYTIDPVHGNYFGLLLPNTTSAFTMLTLNLGGTPTVGGESLSFRLLSAERTGPEYTDTDGFSVTYFNTDGVNDMTSWTVAESEANGSAFDSGWLTIAPRAGTTSMMVQLNETSADGLNAPVLAVDFVPVTPVPEPESIAMMLAGLGVLGAVRRRNKAKAA